MSVVSVPFDDAMGDGSAMSLLGLKGWGDFCGLGWRRPCESLGTTCQTTIKTRLRLVAKGKQGCPYVEERLLLG